MNDTKGMVIKKIEKAQEKLSQCRHNKHLLDEMNLEPNLVMLKRARLELEEKSLVEILEGLKKLVN